MNEHPLTRDEMNEQTTLIRVEAFGGWSYRSAYSSCRDEKGPSLALMAAIPVWGFRSVHAVAQALMNSSSLDEFMHSAYCSDEQCVGWDICAFADTARHHEVLRQRIVQALLQVQHVWACPPPRPGAHVMVELVDVVLEQQLRDEYADEYQRNMRW